MRITRLLTSNYFLALFFYFCFSNLVIAAPPNGTIARVGGDITGTLNYCGQGGSEGILVHIPGQSFSSRTNVTGDFNLVYVQPGTWNLEFIKNNKTIGRLDGVNVVSKMTTDLALTNGVINICNDLDGDGYTPDLDCDEGNPAVNPGAAEICGDGVDNNCSQGSDENCPTCTDIDGDGFYAQAFCTQFRDCNDSDPSIAPGALEICGDGIDNNCDGQIDEDTPDNGQTFYLDSDSDGYGSDVNTINSCLPPEGYTTVGGDCNDSSAGVYPGNVEICANGIDDNCDTIVDDTATCVVQGQCNADDIAIISSCTLNDTACLQGLSQQCLIGALEVFNCANNNLCFDTVDPTLCAFQSCPVEWENAFGGYTPPPPPPVCIDGEIQSCGNNNVGICSSGTQTCVGGQWGSCSGEQGPEPEICDGLDNNCNGSVDEGVCVIDQDGDGSPSTEDCDDLNPFTYPGALEVCDGVDNNCNEAIDEGLFQSVPNGQAFCDFGNWSVNTCNAGYSDCNFDGSDGCEIFTAGGVCP